MAEEVQELFKISIEEDAERLEQILKKSASSQRGRHRSARDDLPRENDRSSA
jgi:hypothetical protein